MGQRWQAEGPYFHGRAADAEREEIHLPDGDRIGLPDCIAVVAIGAIHARGSALVKIQVADLPGCDPVLLIDPVFVCLSAGRHTSSPVVDAADVVQGRFHQMSSGVHTGSIHSESVRKRWGAREITDRTEH